ncbi:MAG: hypothetical protein LBS79_06750, partial [Tannerella sp.]|jgi:hypothetical protein|nr:hypothetical protein [Tannerella sp.]
MAPKKKKKINLQAQQKLHVAQHRKLFMERLRKICTLIGDGEPLFDLLPPYLRKIVYANRSAMIKIKVEESAKITKRFVRIMYGYIEEDIKTDMLDLMIPGKDKQVTLVDYFQLLLPLEYVLTTGPGFVGKEKFDAFCLNHEKRFDKYYGALGKIIHSTCYTCCDLGKRALYTFSFEVGRVPFFFNHQPYTCGMFYQTVTLGLYPLDVRYVTIQGGNRPVVQVGVIRHSSNKSTLIPTTVPLARLHVNSPDGQAEIPVYVQQHAVDRTMQRACCLYPGSVITLINDAFSEKYKIIREGNRYLVESYGNDVKIGYFVGMIIDGIFVILTFLLITHNSTPEGRKLAELTGLQREDLSFLAIDDLKTLANSDIRTDERIAKIFTEAGCGSILDMNFRLNVTGEFQWLRDEARQNSELSKLIAEYIRLGDTDKEYFENE